MLTAEDLHYWDVESTRLVDLSTTSAQLEGSLVFMDTAERIRILTRVVETTSHGDDLLGIATLLDKEWVYGIQTFDWQQLIPRELHSLAKNFQQTPSGYLAFFRHKVIVTIINFVSVGPYIRKATILRGALRYCNL